MKNKKNFAAETKKKKLKLVAAFKHHNHPLFSLLSIQHLNKKHFGSVYLERVLKVKVDIEKSAILFLIAKHLFWEIAEK